MCWSPPSGASSGNDTFGTLAVVFFSAAAATAESCDFTDVVARDDFLVPDELLTPPADCNEPAAAFALDAERADRLAVVDLLAALLLETER